MALAELHAALTAKKVDDAVRIFSEMQAAGAIDADTRALAALATLAARNRHNETAWAAYAHGKSSAGTREMRGAGLNFNAVLYACCRDPAMCEKALSVWDDMAEQGVPPELEPISKLMLSCLARGRFDDGFRIFLAAIDANLQPGAQVCCALLRTCGVAPRLATMAYAVFVTMKSAGSSEVRSALHARRVLCALQCAPRAQCMRGAWHGGHGGLLGHCVRTACRCRLTWH